MVGGMALPGNPYDGHPLMSALLQVRRMTGGVITEVVVGLGYRGHSVEGRGKIFRPRGFCML